MTGRYPTFTPVNLLTGFLGSGKTTLLRRLLSDPRLADTAVLINEFGEVGLDHHLLERIDETTVLLQSGCLCCTIRGELSSAIRELESRRARGEIPAFNRLVIESTGLADPFPVLTTLRADPVLQQHFRAGSVVTTIDGVNGPQQIQRYDEAVKQIAAADHLVVTKRDLADPTLYATLSADLARLNPTASLAFLPDADREIDAVALLQDETSGLLHLEDHDHASHHHSGHVRSFSITVDQPVDWTAFGIWLTMLLNRHGEAVLRVKCILNLIGEEAPIAVHGVQHLVHPPVHMAAWPGAERQSRLVFIVDGLDPALLRRSFEVFNGLAASDPVALQSPGQPALAPEATAPLG